MDTERLEELRTNIRYDPKTGRFYRLTQNANGNLKPGDETGSYNGDGYSTVCVNNKRYVGHKAAWYLYYGEWPDFYIDHIDGNKKNNRITNLRKSDPCVNMRNRGRNKNNHTGYTAIYKQNDKWRVRIGYNGGSVSCGSYDCIEEAIKVRDLKYQELGFTESHGRRRSWNED